MNKTPPTLSLALALAALVVPTAAADDGNCTNYGIVIQAGSTNSYDCQAQYCYQGTGAGGPGSSEAGAEASAGTECDQSQGEVPRDCPEASPCPWRWVDA